MRVKIHVSPSAALSVVLTCLASDALPDMSTVTESRITVRNSGGVEVVWDTIVDFSSPVRRVIRHRFVAGVDFATLGTYTLRVDHDTPNGVIPSRTVLTVDVVPKWVAIQ